MKQSTYWKVGPLDYARVGSIRLLRWGATEFYHELTWDCWSLQLGCLTLTRQGYIRSLMWGGLHLITYIPGCGLRIHVPTN